MKTFLFLKKTREVASILDTFFELIEENNSEKKLEVLRSFFKKKKTIVVINLV